METGKMLTTALRKDLYTVLISSHMGKLAKKKTAA
jgi:hypothetical protein